MAWHALESMGHSVITTDRRGAITSFNPAAARLTGWAKTRALGMDVEEVFRLAASAEDGAEPEPHPVKFVLASGDDKARAAEVQLRTRDGKELRVAYSCALLWGRDEESSTSQEHLGAVLVFRDETREHALREHQHHVQRMDAFSKLAGGIAHDFNNLLGGIIGAAELLEEDPDDPGQHERMVQIILDAADRASRLTTKLLTFARKRPPESALVDVHDAVGEAVTQLEVNLPANVEVHVDLEASQSKVVGDLSALQSAVHNLGLNGVQAMPNGGRLDFVTRVVVLDEVVCENSGFDINPGNYVEVEVVDQGTGIAPELLAHLFEPYFTTKEQAKGSGLGLAVVFGAVQQHRGAIHVYSEVGNGTCFRLQFPLAEDGDEMACRSPDAITGEGRILVVDDEPVMRATAEVILEHLGYTVVLATNGKEALERYRDEGDSIDLVLLDMSMPEMDGRECFLALKAVDPEVSVVLSSGFSREADLADLEAAGLGGFIRKPYHSAELSQIIAQALTMA